MTKGHALLALSAVIAGCSTVPQGPAEFVRTVDVDYAKFGACAYREMDKVWPNSIRLVDLRGEETVNVYFEVTTYGPLGVLTVRQFEIVAKKAGEGKSRVEIRTRAGSWPEQAWSKIEICAE